MSPRVGDWRRGCRQERGLAQEAPDHPRPTYHYQQRTPGGMLAGPIVAAYTRPKGYINTAAAAHRAPAHLGSVPERQTATPSSTLPTNSSTTTSREVAVNAISAEEVGSSASPSMPAK